MSTDTLFSKQSDQYAAFRPEYPAELFRFIGADPLGGPAPGLTLPGQR